MGGQIVAQRAPSAPSCARPNQERGNWKTTLPLETCRTNARSASRPRVGCLDKPTILVARDFCARRMSCKRPSKSMRQSKANPTRRGGNASGKKPTRLLLTSGVVAIALAGSAFFWHSTEEPRSQRPKRQGTGRYFSDTACPVVGNLNTRIFHVPGDPNYRQMLEENKNTDNRVCFQSRAQAASAGYRPSRARNSR